MEEIRAELKTVIAKLFGVKDVEIEVSEVPENQPGDYATNIALKLAGVLKKNPREIAEKIRAELIKNSNFSVEIAGPGFLNFILPDEYFVQNIAKMQANLEKNISQNEYLGKKVVCEFSDPNPFKVLHVGHLYTSIVGDSIARIIEFAGGDVIRANFGGDIGLHVAKTLYAYLSAESDTKNGVTPELLAKYYVEGTRAYEEDENAKKIITALNSTIYEIAEKGPGFTWESECLAGDSRFTTDKLAQAYWRGREVSYQYFKDFYARIGVKFDKYYPESTVAPRGLKEVKNGLEQGIYEKSGEAIIFPGEKYGLHTRVFVNQSGLPTYEAKDVGLLFTKWDDYHFDESIVITGNDIIEYMKVVLKSVELMQPELSKRTRHLTHGNVRLPGNEKMSSRKGNFIKAIDVLESVKNLVPEEDIYLGAIRYAFLKYRIGGNIEFDAKESVATTGNSGVYLQYSAVRAKKMLKKCHFANPAPKLAEATSLESAASTSLEPAERALAKKLTEYKGVLRDAVLDLAPHKIANYLYESAQTFSKFYETVKVAGSPREAELARLVAVYLKVMEHGFYLLGIEIPEEM